MWSFLLGLLPKAKLIGLALGGVALIAAGIYVWSLRVANAALEDENVQLRSSLSVARQAAADNLAAYEAAVTERRRQAAVLARQARELAAVRETMTRLRTRTDDAPDSDDGPVAPVLSRVLDGLRRESGAGAGADGARGTPGSSGTPVDLQPRSVAAGGGR